MPQFHTVVQTGTTTAVEPGGTPQIAEKKGREGVGQWDHSGRGRVNVIDKLCNVVCFSELKKKVLMCSASSLSPTSYSL